MGLVGTRSVTIPASSGAFMCPECGGTEYRVQRVRRFMTITAMPLDDSGAPDLAIARRSLPGLSDEQLLRHPGVLSGSTDEIAERLRGYRDTYGITETSAVGVIGDDVRQRTDAARARAAILRAQQLAARAAEPESTVSAVGVSAPRL